MAFDEAEVALRNLHVECKVELAAPPLLPPGAQQHADMAAGGRDGADESAGHVEFYQTGGVKAPAGNASERKPVTRGSAAPASDCCGGRVDEPSDRLDAAVVGDDDEVGPCQIQRRLIGATRRPAEADVAVVRFDFTD